MYMMMTMAISMMILMITVMSKMMKMNIKNKMNKTPFECGFSMMKNQSKTPFSIQFFILTIMFIIFDVEISMLLAMMTPMNKWTNEEWGLSSMYFMMTMIIGLLMEWEQSSMYWTK